jgi:hypothetical protein
MQDAVLFDGSLVSQRDREEEKVMNLVVVSVLGGVVVVGLIVAAIAVINKFAD